MDNLDHRRRRTSRSHRDSLQPVQGVAQVGRSPSSSDTQPPVSDQAQPFGNNAGAQSVGFDHPYHASDRYPYTQHYSPPQSEIYRDYSRGEYGSGDRCHPLSGGSSSRNLSSPSQIPPQQPYVSQHTQYSALPQHTQYQEGGLDDSPRNLPQQPSAPQRPQHPRTSAFATTSAGRRRSKRLCSARGGALPVGPSCRYPNCFLPVIRDERTHELTEYCGLEHMRDDIRRGVLLCLACDRYPRRTGGDYCGSHCECETISLIASLWKCLLGCRGR
ncbi:hypothetical protein BC826DRAFT_1005299 [Russula brevipes]|nr:hypothetical protein BC826DRAFT_1005299 [Russula brevipes]